MIIIIYSFLVTGNSFWTLHIRFKRGVLTIAQAVYEISEDFWDILYLIYIYESTYNGGLETD